MRCSRLHRRRSRPRCQKPSIVSTRCHSWSTLSPSSPALAPAAIYPSSSWDKRPIKQRRSPMSGPPAQPQMLSDFITDTQAFGRLIKSWATQLDYFSQPVKPTPPTASIPAQATWALPPMTTMNLAIAGSPMPATVSVVAMTWNTFAGILHNADHVQSLGVISNPSNVQNVVIIQGSNTDMVLRLPPKVRIHQAEATLLGGARYEIPGFYNTLFPDP